MLIKLGKRAICLEGIVQIVPLEENGQKCFRLSFSGHEAYILYERTFPQDYAELKDLYDAIPRLDAKKHQLF